MQHDQVTFLLVEDDDVEVLILKRSFKELKIANPIIVAHDGIEALNILRGENGHEKIDKPYIVLLDLNMPRMNGLEFLKILRSDPELSESVVLVLTTSNDDQDKTKAFEHNVAGYIVKSNAGESFMNALAMIDLYWRVVELPSP